MLQGLAGDIQLQVCGVNHATDEVEVVGQQLLAFVHDLHVGAVQLQAGLEVPRIVVKGCAGGDEHQGVILQGALGVDLDGAQGVGVVVVVGLVVLGVLLVGDVGLGPLPNGNHGVDGL